MWSSWALWHQDPLASGLIGLGRPSVLGAIRTKLCNKHKTLRYGQNFEERAKLWNTDKTLQYRHNCAIRIQFCIWHQRQEMCKYMSVCVVSMSWVWVKVCMKVCMLWQAVVWVCVCRRIYVTLLLWYAVERLGVIGDRRWTTGATVGVRPTQIWAIPIITIIIDDNGDDDDN